MNQANVSSLGEQDTVCAVLQRAVSANGSKPFIDLLGEVYTYADLDRESSRLAHGLRGLGVEHGQTVVTIVDNNIDAVFLWFAINKLGAVSVPVNTAYKGEFLRHQLADAGARVIITESDYAERVQAIAGGLSEATTLVHRGERPPTDSQLKLLHIDQIRSEEIHAPDVQVLPTDLAMLIYTGGTTGPSKGCMVSHNYACSLARQAAVANGRNSDTINWTPLPLFHMNATSTSILAQMMVGGRVAVYPRFSVSNFWAEIERTGANDVNLLGSMVPLLLNAPETEVMKRCYGQIRHVGAAPFPAELQAAWKKRFGTPSTVVPGYGLTEASLLTSAVFGEPSPPGSSGKRNPWFDVRIVDDNEVEQPAGVSGEVIVRPCQAHVMFEGYWNRPADTLKVLGNLWFHTGDIGKFDEEGYFYFVDRKKDYLRRRGENISSYEMETSFRAHEAIEDVAVHAVPSEFTEDEVKVTAILKPGVQLSEEELCLWAVDQLPYFAVPRFIEFRKELPRNPVGRVLKYELRDQGITAATWDREASGMVLKKR
ncbi:AMP-binding protein [Pseudomonas sp. JAI120]|uniref:AMP-binding protein n=1 Tax=Pseudomonas sp. JAI120 TaxID=2723063 RepID=UPI0030EE375F